MNVYAEVREMMKMPMTRLKARYAEAFGEATRSSNREYLVKRIAWRLQAQKEGDLSERARRRAEELANDADLRTRAPWTANGGAGPQIAGTLRVPRRDREPQSGAMLVREYKGQRVAVKVLSKGYEFEGEVYRSLSAIANKVTGSHWNGKLFFNLAAVPGTNGASDEQSEATA